MLKKRDTRQFVVINEEKLISEVQHRPILYDKALKGYRKPTIRDHAWQAVADSLQSTVEESKKRWRSLRDAFMKQYKQCQGDDPRSIKKKKWLFYDQMEFLIPFLEVNYSFVNIKDEEYEEESHTKSDSFIYKMEYLDDCQVKGAITNDKDPIIIDNDDDDVDHEEDDNNLRHDIEVNGEIINVYDKDDVLNNFLKSPGCTDVNRHANKSIQIVKPNSEKDTDPIQSDSTISSTNIYGLDPEERFLLSCAPILKRLPAKKNAYARLKIQQILYDIEFGDSCS